MSEITVKIEVSIAGVGRITLSRPLLHNAFDDQMIEQLTAAILMLEDDDNVTLIVLDAEGKSFSAGADLNWMKRMANYTWEQNYKDSLKLAELMRALYQCKKTTIAIVQGAAFGGGVGLVACCDIVLASEKAAFCLSEVKLGLIPSVISPYVVKAIGERQAKRYFVTAEKFSSHQACLLGLVHEVFSAESLSAETDKLISQILTNGPAAMRKAKSLINFVLQRPIEQELIAETAKRIADTRASDEGQEGVGAFLEKRKPDWL